MALKKKQLTLFQLFSMKMKYEIFIKNFEKARLILIEERYDVNLILVNDGSTDKSLETAKKLSKNKKYIKLISLSKNFGQQIAIFTGLENIKLTYMEQLI